VIDVTLCSTTPSCECRALVLIIDVNSCRFAAVIVGLTIVQVLLGIAQVVGSFQT
jgi:hypothetical protein